MKSETQTLHDLIREERDAVESKLVAQVSTIGAVADEFAMQTVKRNLGLALDRLRAEEFEIMVAGRFKVGKSTFLNALLLSSSHGKGPDSVVGPLPVDQLPCTAVLTRVVYSETPFVRAVYFGDRVEEWTFERYLNEAKIYGDEGAGTGVNRTLEQVRSFEVGVPAELLRSGLVLIDSPGISEDPRRTALTRDALSRVHASILMFRSDGLAGTDELEFGSEVMAQTGHVFPVVNMFHNQPATERLRAVLTARLASLRTLSSGDKLDQDIHYIECNKAFDGYRTADPNLVTQSGIRGLEQKLGSFLMNGAYSTRVRTTIDGAKSAISVLEDELTRLTIALQAEEGGLHQVLESCDADMRDVRARRYKVEEILERTTRAAIKDAEDSYRAFCRELATSIEGRFAEREIPSLTSIGGKISALMTSTAAREAGEILHEIVQEAVCNWAEAPPIGRGLQRDLSPTLERARRDLRDEYDEIDTKLRAISLKIGALDPNAPEICGVVSFQERLMAAGLGVVMLGPVGGLAMVGGWRGVAGAALGVMATKLGLTLLAGALGISLAPAILIGLMVTTVFSGALLGGTFNLEGRIRIKALEAFRPWLDAMITDEAAFDELRQGISSNLESDRQEVLRALDVVLAQQEESLKSLREASNHGLDVKRERLNSVRDAQSQLMSARAALKSLEVDREGEATSLAA